MAPGEGNLDPTGPQLQAGWVPTLRYTSLGGATHTSSVTEVAEWVQTLAPPDTYSTLHTTTHTPAAFTTTPPTTPPRHTHTCITFNTFYTTPDILSPFTTTPPYSPAPADLNLDGAGKPLSFSSAIRGPHGKEWTLADKQELIKLLVTFKCLLPVMCPAKTPTYLKRVIVRKTKVEIRIHSETRNKYSKSRIRLN